MASLSIQGEQFVVQLGFWEKLGGLSKDLTVPISSISKISWSENLDAGVLGIRVGGTGLPRVIALGNFYKKGKTIFSSWRRGQQVLILEIENHRFQKLVLGCEDAASWAKALHSSV